MIWKTAISKKQSSISGQVGAVEGIDQLGVGSSNSQNEVAVPLGVVFQSDNPYYARPLEFDLLDFKTSKRAKIKLKDPDPFVKRNFPLEECVRVEVMKDIQVPYQVPVPQSVNLDCLVRDTVFWHIANWGGTVVYVTTDAYLHHYRFTLGPGVTCTNLNAFDGTTQNGDMIYVPKNGTTTCNLFRMYRTIQETRYRTESVLDYCMYKYNSLRDKLFRLTYNIF